MNDFEEWKRDLLKRAGDAEKVDAEPKSEDLFDFMRPDGPVDLGPPGLWGWWEK